MITAAAKAAYRTSERRRRVAGLHDAGKHRQALDAALDGLRSEARQVEKHRPGGAEALYRQLTDRITQLAEAVPGFRPGA